MGANNGGDATDFLVNHATKPFARLLLAHGAGAAMDSDFMEKIAAAIAQRGVEVVRFEFPYMAKRRINGKRRPPDRKDVLLDCWEKIIHHYGNESLPLFIGGKSMGGRMASILAEGSAAKTCSGVVCLGYPFHPAGKPEKLRVEHLFSSKMPILIIQGERDPMGGRDEVAGYGLAEPVTICWLAAANHDLKPLRSSGYTHQRHIDQAAETAVAFMRKTISVRANQ